MQATEKDLSSLLRVLPCNVRDAAIHGDLPQKDPGRRILLQKAVK